MTEQNKSKQAVQVAGSNYVRERKKTSQTVEKSHAAVVRSHNGKYLEAKKHFNIITKKKKNKTPFPIGKIFPLLLVTAMVLFMVMNYAEIDKYNSDIAELKGQLTDLQKEANKLEQRLDKKNNLVYIEEYATEELGMVKSTDLTRVNITLVGEDKGDIIKYNDGKEGGLGTLLSGFGEVIRNFFE
ncbi:MAG: septum formation initiator family protein [Clostridia bacterium]